MLEHRTRLFERVERGNERRVGRAIAMQDFRRLIEGREKRMVIVIVHGAR